MKVISHEDLMILIPLIKDCPTWSMDEFKLLLERFGSDYFFEDGEFTEVTVNEEMNLVRKNMRGE